MLEFIERSSIWLIFSDGVLAVEQPVSAISGFKVLETVQEIGIVRFGIDKALTIHDSLLAKDDLVGKTYNKLFDTACKGLNLTACAAATSERIYHETFPGFIVRRTDMVPHIVWKKWVSIDEFVSTKLSDKLEAYPFAKKSPMEIIEAVDQPFEESRLWKFTEKVADKIRDVFNYFRRTPGKKSFFNFCLHHPEVSQAIAFLIVCRIFGSRLMELVTHPKIYPALEKLKIYNSMIL